MGKKRGKYTPKEENVRKLFAFIRQIEDKKDSKEKKPYNNTL